MRTDLLRPVDESPAPAGALQALARGERSFGRRFAGSLV